MPAVSTQTEFFIPAATTGEAVARIFSLTGGQPRNRGEKRALVALRDAVGLDLDVVRTNAVMGAHLAEALHVDWRAEEFTVRNKVNLAGLNALLEGATEAFQKGSLGRAQGTSPASLTGPQWSGFNAAVSKIEAVTRLASLTDSPPEWLGPGSKEHKSVLVNLADNLLPADSLDRSSKTRMARDIASRLDVAWTDTCYSTGETISLEGLNVILAGAERRLGRLGESAADQLASAESEGAALAAALVDGWRAEAWDGRACVEWLDASGARGANDNEWQGFYFEARARELLNAAFPPSTRPVRSRYGNTVFDFSLNRVWDLKAHTTAQYFPSSGRRRARGGALILNDERATRACIEEQGLGFLVLSGEALMDEDGRFVEWHRARKVSRGATISPSNSGRSTVRKSAFRPLRVDALWVQDTPSLDAALSAGHLAVRPIGRQPPKVVGGSGTPRADKFQMNLGPARGALSVWSGEWHYRSSSW